MKRLAVILFFVAALTAVFLPLSKRLCVVKSGSSSIVEFFDRNAEGFVISYTHSVNRGRVRDYYTLTGDGAVCLNRTVFTSYGAGIPEPYGKQIFRMTEDGFEISNIDMELKEIILQTGIIADHHIETANKSVVLNEIIPPQTRIIIGSRRISFYDMITVCLRNSFGQRST